jgi:inosine-uridine nucleoside N-ribohydrolase
LEYQPIDANTVWSMMWDEVCVASLLDPKVISKWEELYMDAVIDHGAKYGHSLVWRRPPPVLSFFQSYSGPDPVDLGKWQGHYQPPYNRHPARVQTEVDLERYRSIFINLLSRH